MRGVRRWSQRTTVKKLKRLLSKVGTGFRRLFSSSFDNSGGKKKLSLRTTLSHLNVLVRCFRCHQTIEVSSGAACSLDTVKEPLPACRPHVAVFSHYTVRCGTACALDEARAAPVASTPSSHLTTLLQHMPNYLVGSILVHAYVVKYHDSA